MGCAISGGQRTLRGHQAITLALLFVAGMVNFFDRSSLSVANTTIRGEMHLNGTQMGWLLSAFSLAYGVAQLPLIGLLDRAGTRPVLGAGLAMWSAAQFATGFVGGFPAFLVCRVLLGAGEAPFYPSAVRSIREWFTERTRGRATGLMSSSQTFGLAIAPPVLTWVMVRVGWRATFAGLGVSGILVAAVWVWLHRDRAETPYRHAEDLPPQRNEAVWGSLLRQRTVWGMMLGWGGINYTAWLYIAWLPGYLNTARHLSLAKSGWVAAIPFLAGALGMLLSGIVSDALVHAGESLSRVHRRNLVVGMIVSAGCTFLVARSETTLGAVAGISLAFFSIQYAGTSGWGYVQCVSPERFVASLSALQNFASFMIASAAPVVTGWLLDRTHSFTLALGICSAVTLLGALSYATLAAPSGMRLQEAARPS